MNSLANIETAVEVVCGCDEKFLPHAATMICSLLEHNQVATIHFLHDNIPAHKLEMLREFVNSYGSILVDYAINDARIATLKVNGHASTANYFRLLIPELLPPTISKVLYLDCDLIVRKSLAPLWNIDISAYAIGAVANSYSLIDSNLGLPRDKKYFNSGVMLINVSRWRDEQIHLQVIDFIRQNPERIRYWDQDGLNVVLMDAWLELAPEWNVMNMQLVSPYLRERFVDIIQDPAIMHFAGSGQLPWQSTVQHPFKREYIAYRNRTPWKMPPADKVVQWLAQLRPGLKSVLRTGVHLLARIIAACKIANPAIVFARRFENELSTLVQQPERYRRQERLQAQITQLSPDLTVLAGPFKGMKYAAVRAVGSAIVPKLLGSYEAELHPIIEEICQTSYSVIIDVGCAEGYYAVGLAMRMPEVTVYAYDISPLAQRLCSEMAALNGVADRVHIREVFTEQTLSSLPAVGRGLLIADCEGCERYLFHQDSEMWPHLENYDLLVEIHDFISPGIGDYLSSVFAQHYTLQSILSVGDTQRPRTFPNPYIERFSSSDQVDLMSESRPTSMEWFYLKSKRNLSLGDS